MAFEANLTIYSSHVPWGGDTGEADIWMAAEDWSAAAFVLKIDSPSPITLTNAAAGSQGISATYDADYVSKRTGAQVGGTCIRPLITEATLEELDFGSGTELTFNYDLLVTPSGASQRVICFGQVTMRKGVAD